MLLQSIDPGAVQWNGTVSHVQGKLDTCLTNLKTHIRYAGNETRRNRLIAFLRQFEFDVAKCVYHTEFANIWNDSETLRYAAEAAIDVQDN